VFRPGQLQASATFGKTMEQVRNRQNIYLRSEITPSAKFLALSITPLDSDHAECGGMFNRCHSIPIWSFSSRSFLLVWAEGGPMLIWSKIFALELRSTKFGGLAALPKGFPKMPRKVDQSPLVSGKSGPKFKFRPPISPPPGGFWGQFWHRAIWGL